MTGIPFALISLGFDLVDGVDINVGKFIFLSFFFGLAMSLIMGTLHRKRLKNVTGQELNDQNLSVNQHRNIKSKLDKSELLEKLKKDPVISKMNLQEVENGILLKTGITWMSWGEEIKIIQQSDQENDFEYQISSRPKMKTTLVDYGKNLENVTLIENTIKNFA